LRQEHDCISHKEFHPVEPLLLSEVLETGIVLERSRSRFDPGAK